MQIIPKNLSTVLLLTMLAACGSGGSNGAVAKLPVVPPPAPPPSAGTLGDGRLDTLLEWARASQDVPAMGVVVVASDQIVEMSAVGRRVTTANTNVTTEDRWHIGSLTKALTATLAGVLVEQSVIGWDTTPLDVWPELDQAINPAFRAITLRHLLSHTSGMRRVDATPEAYDQNAAKPPMQKRRAFAAELLAEPPIGPVGRESYSNGAFIVAAAMMETRMSTPWETLLRQQVFGPLGMQDSGFGAPGSPDALDQPRGHFDHGTAWLPVVPGPDADNPDTMGPAGTVHVSLADYGRFMLAHLAGARGIGGLLTAPTFEFIQTPVVGGPALGWGVTPYQDWAEGPVFSFAGSNQRWYAIVRMAPALNAGAMIVVNAGGGRAEAAIDAFDDLLLERFESSR